MLECSDGTCYIGVTNDLARRMKEHKEGLIPDCYTISRRPLILKHYLIFGYINDAIYYEKKLKRWSRAKKEAFFKKDLKTLHEKAKCLNKTTHKNYIPEGRAEPRPENE